MTLQDSGSFGSLSFDISSFALFIYLLELLVAALQAFVFTMLSAVFVGMMIHEHHDEHHETKEERLAEVSI